MSDKCNHQFQTINPFQRICCNCNKVVNVVNMKNCSKKEFEEMYSTNRECGPIIFDDAPDFKR